MTRIFKAETVGELTALRGNLATLYLSTVDALHALETRQESTATSRCEYLCAELAAVDVAPLTNPADHRW